MHKQMQHKYSSQDVVFSENVHVHVGHVILFGKPCDSGLETLDNLSEFGIVIPYLLLFFGVSNETASVSDG